MPDTDILIILRAGRSSLHRIWTSLARGAVDIVLSVYDDSDIGGAEFKLIHRAVGGKYQAAVQLFEDHPELITNYKFFWFVDDDMFIPLTSLHRLGKACKIYNFAICQPSLTPDSFFSWPMTVTNNSFIWRATDFTEIMCPMMRRDFLLEAIPHMGHTFTGWGQEFIWREMLKRRGELAGIIDIAPVTHTRPVGGGAIYDRYEGGPKGAFKESLAVLDRLRIPHDPSFKNFFALSRDPAVGLVSGDTFLGMALEGYLGLEEFMPDEHNRCIVDVKARVAQSGGVGHIAYLPGWHPITV